jgi:surface antigen
MQVQAHAGKTRIRRRLVVALVTATIATTGIIVANPAAADTMLCSGNNYSTCTQHNPPYTDHGYGAVSGNSYWNMIAGHNCTNYVAYVVGTVNGSSDHSGLGNASNWGHVLYHDDSPAVGAVAWWDAAAWNGYNGHVAYVESFDSNSIKVSEDNYSAGPFQWRVITRTGGSWPNGFIHLKDISYERPMWGGTFFLRNSNTTGVADITFNYGGPSDIPLAGDWNGDGVTTIGVYEPGNRTFYLRNSNNGGGNDYTATFGNPGDLPVVGDWNGNGTDTIGLFRPSTGEFFLSNSNTNPVANYSFHYGGSGHIPLAGDWNGDGVDTIGVYEPGIRTFYLRNSNNGGGNDYTATFGNPGDYPVMGDWDGNGTDTIGLFHPSSAQFFLSNTNTNPSAAYSFVYGGPDSSPIAGNWDHVGGDTIGVA